MKTPYERVVKDPRDRLITRSGDFYGLNGTVKNIEDVSGSGEGGTTDHSQLSNRNVPNQHPISSITNLQTSLTDLVEELKKVEDSLTAIIHIQDDDIPTKDDLPTNLTLNDVGNLYIVNDTGFAYIWTGTIYRQINGLTDLTNYYNKSQVDVRLTEKQNDTTAAQAGEVLVGGDTPGTFDIKPVDSSVTSKPITNTDHLVTASGIYDADQQILNKAITADTSVLNDANAYTDEKISELPMPESGISDAPADSVSYVRLNEEWHNVQEPTDTYRVLGPVKTTDYLYPLPMAVISGDGRTVFACAKADPKVSGTKMFNSYISRDGKDFEKKVLYTYTLNPPSIGGTNAKLGNPSISISYDGNTMAAAIWSGDPNIGVCMFVNHNNIWQTYEGKPTEMDPKSLPVVAVSKDGTTAAFAWSVRDVGTLINVGVWNSSIPSASPLPVEISLPAGCTFEHSKLCISSDGQIITLFILNYQSSGDDGYESLYYQSRDRGLTYTRYSMTNTPDKDYGTMVLDIAVDDNGRVYTVNRTIESSDFSGHNSIYKCYNGAREDYWNLNISSSYGYGDNGRAFCSPDGKRFGCVLATQGGEYDMLMGYCYQSDTNIMSNYFTESLTGSSSGFGPENAAPYQNTYARVMNAAISDNGSTIMVITLIPAVEDSRGPVVYIFDEKNRDKYGDVVMSTYTLPSIVDPYSNDAKYTAESCPFTMDLSDDGSVFSVLLTGALTDVSKFQKGALWRGIKYVPFTPDAPKDGTPYIKIDGRWAPLSIYLPK